MWLDCISVKQCPHLRSLCCKSILKTPSYGSPISRPCDGNPGSLTNHQHSLKRAAQSSIPAGTMGIYIQNEVSSMILQSVVVVSERGQIQEGVDQQQQQQRQHQRQAPVVGDQHLITASLQEGAITNAGRLVHIRHTHTHTATWPK